MLYFENDYNVAAHDAVIKRLAAENGKHFTAYGADTLSDSASKKIKESFRCPSACVFFLEGGTQTNAVVIDSVLDGCEGVVAAATGHISGHEAGAIEYSGHKVLAIGGHDGKLDACNLDAYIKDFYADRNHTHMVPPGMVYISHPTEYGTLYTKAELKALHDVCAGFGIPLYLDGARLGYGLGAPGTDVTAADIAALTDIFYIGGTKMGALFGEALVFSRGNAPKHFVTKIKQHGAMLAKGWLIGLQFDELFTDNLYLSIGVAASEKAKRFSDALSAKGCKTYIPTQSNQIFIVLENSRIEFLRSQIALGFWEKYDETHSVVRIAVSFATSDEEIEEALKLF